MFELRPREKTPVTTDTAMETAGGSAIGARLARHATGARESGVLAGLLLLCLIGTFGTEGFLDSDNLLNVGQQVSLVGIMAIGMTFVIITAEIDLSVGSIYALAAVITGLMISDGTSPVLAMAAGLGAGTFAGFLNGAITVGFGIPSFIVTLGTLGIYRGVALLISNGESITIPAEDPSLEWFTFLGQGKVAGIPMQFICFLVVAAIGYFVLKYCRLGFQTYAVGGNHEAARLCGLPVNRVRLIAFTLLGLLSAFAGIVSLAFISYVQGATGLGLELTVITAVIVGGAALFGGSGTVLGTVVGVFLIGVLQNVLVLGGIPSFWQTIAIGIVIIVAVGIDTAIRRRQGV